MISLSGDSILLRDGAGELQPRELDGLRGEVIEALELSGRPDVAVAEDLMRVVRHFAASAVRSGRVLDLDEVRALIVRALRDAGYCDAAVLMEDGGPIFDLGDALMAVEASEIAALLAQDARFVGLDRGLLAQRAAEALAAAGLSRITCAGAVEIAVSLAVEDAEEPNAEQEASYWLLNGDNWGGLLTDALAPAVEDGRVRLYPVSRLAPTLEVVVDLRRFVDADTELAILPALDSLLALLADTLIGVPESLAASCRDIVPDVVTGRLRLVGGESVGSGRLKLTGVHLYSFLEDLRKTASARLFALPWMVVEPCGQSVTTRGNRKAAE